jgi:predicted glycosyltransferase
MDNVKALEAEWRARDVIQRMEQYFDDVWVYGPEGFHNPLAGLQLSEELQGRFAYTGFLRRELPTAAYNDVEGLPRSYILVTAGGGGDGAPMMRAVLEAHRHRPVPDHELLVVLGPFMRVEDREDIRRRAAGLGGVRLIDFHARHEILVQHASAVVSMAGYNTFCEILSLDQRALLIPRVAPREEQLIRARRGAALGLVDMLLPDEANDPVRLSDALHALIARPRPLAGGRSTMLDGLERICSLVRGFFPRGARRDVFLPPAAE